MRVILTRAVVFEEDLWGPKGRGRRVPSVWNSFRRFQTAGSGIQPCQDPRFCTHYAFDFEPCLETVDALRDMCRRHIYVVSEEAINILRAVAIRQSPPTSDEGLELPATTVGRFSPTLRSHPQALPYTPNFTKAERARILGDLSHSNKGERTFGNTCTFCKGKENDANGRCIRGCTKFDRDAYS